MMSLFRMGLTWCTMPLTLTLFLYKTRACQWTVYKLIMIILLYSKSQEPITRSKAGFATDVVRIWSTKCSLQTYSVHKIIPTNHFYYYPLYLLPSFLPLKTISCFTVNVNTYSTTRMKLPIYFLPVLLGPFTN